jgi:hypothetical protein
MKTIIVGSIVALCFLLTSDPSYCQRKKVWSIGPEIGVNFSKYGMDANYNESVSGITGGLFLTYSVLNTFGITGKILYSEKGADLGAREEILKYIEVPIMGRFFLNKSGKFRPNLFLGPTFGFLRGVSNKTGSSDPVKLVDYQAAFNTYDIGATAGLGLNYEVLRETRFLIDARYTYGLTDITKRPAQINNETISVTFGISFGI